MRAAWIGRAGYAMTKRKTPSPPPPPPTPLRQEAEARLKKRRTKSKVPWFLDADMPRLVHELQVHQIELEMQNEELQGARLATEAGLARYTELFDYAPIGYVTIDPGGTIAEVNHAGAAIFGVARSRLLGQRIDGRVALLDREVFLGLLERAAASEKSESRELRVILHGEAPVHVRVTATLLLRPTRTFLLALENITARKTADEKLRRAEVELRDASRRKDEFLAMLSHELRNPLAPIRNGLDVLGHAEPSGERARWALTVIDRQVTQLTRLVDDLLDVTRIGRGKIELRPQRVELGELVNGVIADHTGNLELAGLRLERVIDAGEYWVEGDPARLVQILGNLLGNAEKFTPRGGLVTVELGRLGDRARLQVRDSGIGISPSLLGHLFEPFAQAPQTMDRAHGGLGLGLAMVKGLVELHGGAVRITSAGPGQGTEVSVSLPLTEVAPRAARVSESALRRSRRVLVIEDNLDSADTLKYALELGGGQVEVAYDGPTGLDLARKFHPEVVICDIGLPGMDGYAVARAVRADGELRDEYLVALSGYAQAEDRQRAMEAGFNRHIAKPTSLEQLAQLLDEVPDKTAAASPHPN